MRYDVLHTLWLEERINGFLVTKSAENAQNKRFYNNSVEAVRSLFTIVKPTIRIFYTIDTASLRLLNVKIIGMIDRYNESTPDRVLFKMALLDVAPYIDETQRITILKTAIMDAFDAWNTAMNHTIDFAYLPYDAKLRLSKNFNKIIVVAAKRFYHLDEHTLTDHSFASTDTLAHAGVNVLHINVNSVPFFLAPHKQRKHLETASLIEAAQSLRIETLRVDQAKTKFSFADDKSMFYRINRYFQEKRRTVAGKTTCLYCTIMHEIGHILGLGHARSKDSLMYMSVIKDDEYITETDKNAARYLYERVEKQENTIYNKLIHNMCARVTLKKHTD